MDDVGLGAIAIADPHRLVLPEEATALAYGAGGPLIAVLDDEARRRHVVVGFDLLRSNWPVHVSFAIFVRNALDHVTERGRADAGRWIRADESIRVEAMPGRETIVVRGPRELEVAVDEQGTAVLPPLGRAGLYRLAGVAPPGDRLAVNLASPVESDLAPRSEVVIGRTPVARAVSATSEPRDLWPWVVAGVIALLAIEWAWYARQAGLG